MSEKKKFMNSAKYAFLCALFAILCLHTLLTTHTVEPLVGTFGFLIISSGAAFILGLGSLLKKSQENKPIAVVAIVVSIVMFFYIISPMLGRINGGNKMVCGTNLRSLTTAMMIYAQEYNGKYPAPDNWCDLLIEYADVDGELFKCTEAKKSKKANLCYFALNPNCEPNSPADTVLLFETIGGWNQFGGVELLSTDNHKGEGCNISYNDNHVSFERKGAFSELKWK